MTTAAAEPKSGSLTVVIAFAANILVAIAKTVAAVVTGSASMVAESAHSWADAGNEVFLLIAERRSARRRDLDHPRGYGKEAYVWSMFAAFGLFSAGAAVSITHGVQELLSPEPADNFGVAYVVLAVSAVLEGISFTQAYRQVRASAEKRGQGTLHHVVSTSNTTLRAVFAEDAAALIGLAIAAAGVLAHQLTGSPIPDAIGSILVGVLLGVVAVVLIDRNRRFLVGESGPAELQQLALARLLSDPSVDRVTALHLEYVGPERFSFTAAVDLVGDHTEAEVATSIRSIATRIEQLEYVTEAVLTLSLPEEPSLVP